MWREYCLKQMPDDPIIYSHLYNVASHITDEDPFGLRYTMTQMSALIKSGEVRPDDAGKALERIGRFFIESGSQL